MLCRVAALDGREHLLLVEIDHHAALHGIPQPRAHNFARLENHITVRQDGRGAGPAAVRHGSQGARVQAAREWIVDEKPRHSQQLGVIRIFHAIALQGAEIVRIPELGAKCLEEGPVTLAGGPAKLALQVIAQVPLEPLECI